MNTVKGSLDNKIQSLHKEKWVDVAKGLAILAVMTDHSRNTLYTNDRIQRISFFSVTLFIMIMGVTTYWSYNNSKIPLWEKVKSRILGIFVPYVVATIVAHCFFNRSFSWDSYYYCVLHFNATGPYYYVLLYVQMLLISPILFLGVKKLESLPRAKMVVLEILGGVGLGLFARILNLYTDISGIYASRLFGGSYLLCIYIGMLFGMNYNKIKNIPKLMRNGSAIVCFFAMAFMIYIIVTKGFVFDKTALLGTDINPPGVTLLIFAVTIMLSLSVCDFGERTYKVLWPLEFIGKHTLYIFLYHILLMSILNVVVKINSSWIRIPLYYVTMIGVSIGIEMILKQCKKIIVEAYLYGKEK